MDDMRWNLGFVSVVGEAEKGWVYEIRFWKLGVCYIIFWFFVFIWKVS